MFKTGIQKKQRKHSKILVRPRLRRDPLRFYQKQMKQMREQIKRYKKGNEKKEKQIKVLKDKLKTCKKEIQYVQGECLVIERASLISDFAKVFKENFEEKLNELRIHPETLELMVRERNFLRDFSQSSLKHLKKIFLDNQLNDNSIHFEGFKKLFLCLQERMVYSQGIINHFLAQK